MATTSAWWRFKAWVTRTEPPSGPGPGGGPNSDSYNKARMTAEMQRFRGDIYGS